MAYGDNVSVQIFPNTWIKQNLTTNGRYIANESNGYKKLFITGFDLTLTLSDWSVDDVTNELTLVFNESPRMYVGMVMEISNSGVTELDGKWRIKHIDTDFKTYKFFKKESVTLPSVLSIVSPTFRVPSLGLLERSDNPNLSGKIKYVFKGGNASEFQLLSSSSYSSSSSIYINSNTIYYPNVYGDTETKNAYYSIFIGNGYGFRWGIKHFQSDSYRGDGFNSWYHGMVDGGYIWYDGLSSINASIYTYNPQWNNLFQYNNNNDNNNDNKNSYYYYYYHYRAWLYNNNNNDNNDNDNNIAYGVPVFLSNQYRKNTIVSDKTVVSQPAVTFKHDLTKTFKIPSYILLRKIEPILQAEGFHLSDEGYMFYTLPRTTEGHYEVVPISDSYWNIEGVDQEWD